MESQDLRKAGLKVTHPRIRILDELPALPGAILLGQDSAEAEEWEAILDLNEITEIQE